MSADRYNVSLGGSTDGIRLNRIYRDLVPAADIPGMLQPVFAAFAAGRRPAETFGAFCARTVGEGAIDAVARPQPNAYSAGSSMGSATTATVRPSGVW